jgi:hypothetical protein
MVDLMNLFINKRFQDVINTDGSDIALLTLLTCVLLKNHRELREKWYTYLGLSKKVNLTKALNRLKAITENSIEIDRLIAKFLNEPLKKTFEDENALIGLYNFCLQDIVKLRRIMRINRMRTFIVQDFHHLEREVVVKFGRKKEKASHDLIIPFPPCYKTIWRKESITVDSVMSGRNNKITSLSLTPTSLKSIIGIGWEYESTIKRIWNRIKRYSKRSIWKIIAIGLFVGGVLLLFFKHATSGKILLTLGSLLLSPLIQEWYSKKRQTQENKRILG